MNNFGRGLYEKHFCEIIFNLGKMHLMIFLFSNLATDLELRGGWFKRCFFCDLCFVFVFVIQSCLFFAALWSPAGKGLTCWLSCVLCFSCVFVTFPYGVLIQVWYLIVLIPDLCFFLTFT